MRDIDVLDAILARIQDNVSTEEELEQYCRELGLPPGSLPLATSAQVAQVREGLLRQTTNESIVHRLAWALVHAGVGPETFGWDSQLNPIPAVLNAVKPGSSSADAWRIYALEMHRRISEDRR